MKDSKDKLVGINEIQGIKYKSVSVYFGTKPKIMVDRGIDQDNIPLMVELVKEDRTNQCEYYCHYHNNKGLYWEKLDVSSYEKYTGTKLKVPMLPPNLNNTGFKVFEHDLSHYDLNYDGCQLKLIIPTTNNMSKYNEITLYNSNNHHSENIENLYYQGGYVDDNVQVYFYDMDPRPLLVSLGFKAYKPKNKDKYSTEWAAIEDFDDYSEGFLNEVNICEHSNNYYNGRDYEIHTYDNIRIQLKVSRDDFGCYTKYEHKSNNSQGYRLGNIVYKRDNKVKGNIIYDYSSFLIQVNVYYYNKDINHEYPLLVELEFKNNNGNSITKTKEHYKLLKGDFHMKWEIDHDASRVATEPQKFREHLDFVKNSFNHVPELKGFSNNCGHNHLQDPTLLNRSYITTSHGTDYSSHGSSSSYEHQVRSDSNHGRSPSRNEARTINHQQGRMSSVQQTHSHQPPAETGVEKATRIASTVGTFAIAGTGTGVAIYKYSHWIINFFKRFF
ncbi:hypothetical protein MACK_003851 [Theileria orientalis]|uniref:Uncharacterized protein n=1 Tax=Theileria orientalis TaxID=68886 RepID=A0A976XJT5_THEOR|nr:hypothetical protein MACK_003851 [Theileria orientalis]